MGSKVIEIKDRIAERDKRKNIKKHLEADRVKEVAKALIDYCEGDFAIVFNKKSSESLFNEVTKDFVVAMSDIEKRDWRHPESFFRNFGSSRAYFDLRK